MVFRSKVVIIVPYIQTFRCNWNEEILRRENRYGKSRWDWNVTVDVDGMRDFMNEIVKYLKS